MNIGIDAKWFFDGNPSGRVVIRNLLRELLKKDTGNHYYVFLRREDKDKGFPYAGKTVTLVYIWGRNNLLSNVLVTPYFAYKYKIDVFLYQYFGPFIKFSKVITLIHDVIFESHPYYFSVKERAYFKPMRQLAARADKIVTVSANEKTRIVKYNYAPVEKIKVIHMGVAEIFFDTLGKSIGDLIRIQKKYSLPSNFVLYVGRLNYRKNIHNLISAFRLVKSKDVKLVLVGGYDWKMFDVKKFIADQNLEDKVMLLGFVEDADLPVLYALSKLFCFVSFEEGFGLPPLEAMASGVPAIVANRGSLPEVCGNAALYVDPFDPVIIASTIDNFFSNPSLSCEMKEKGLKQAAGFGWDKTAQEFLNLFTQVVDQRNENRNNRL